MVKMMKIKQVRSACGRIPKHRKTVKALGLRRLNDERVIVDNVQTRGMLACIPHLVKLLEENVKA